MDYANKVTNVPMLNQLCKMQKVCLIDLLDKCPVMILFSII